MRVLTTPAQQAAGNALAVPFKGTAQEMKTISEWLTTQKGAKKDEKQ
jgi:hypothetical protein